MICSHIVNGDCTHVSARDAAGKGVLSSSVRWLLHPKPPFCMHDLCLFLPCVWRPNRLVFTAIADNAEWATQVRYYGLEESLPIRLRAATFF